MKTYQLAVLFTQSPFGSAISREGLDAVLAASAFCDEEDIAVCFLHDGVFNLLANQQAETILQKDHIATFKLLELYDLNEVFVCRESLLARQLHAEKLILSAPNIVECRAIFDVLAQAQKVLTF